jgi:NAD-dependent SIR2 family protein deacetylase
MTRKTMECISCGAEATIEFDIDQMNQEPVYCPFCGSSYIEDELDDDLDLLKNGGFDDDMDIQW